MSTDAPFLLDAAVGILREIAPSLPGEGRYAALLCASAVATAARDRQAADRIEAARAVLRADAAAIRVGAHDGDRALYERLIAHARLCAWVADPERAPAPAARSEAAPKVVG